MLNFIVNGADLLFLLAASISLGRPEKTVGTGHGVDDSSGQQLVLLNSALAIFLLLTDRIVNIITVRRGAYGDRGKTVVMEEMMELEKIETGRRTEEPLNRDNAFIIAALSFIPRTGVDQEPPRRRHRSSTLMGQVAGVSIPMRGQFHELLGSFYHSSGCHFPSPLPSSWPRAHPCLREYGFSTDITSVTGSVGPQEKGDVIPEIVMLSVKDLRVSIKWQKEHSVSELIKPSRKTKARVERNSTIYHAVEPGVEKGEVDMNEASESFGPIDDVVSFVKRYEVVNRRETFPYERETEINVMANECRRKRKKKRIELTISLESVSRQEI
ncbi:hypothetical protein EAG_16280 [Camponotus floridanus]|uniref:Uncharacterized protein n=1 Tax=Camponotus floridanus TaxID=104421 RepID=E2AGA7_CAMFO|nr:hypothetical protein EAG_16280 [Camponotus floridanus]